MIKFYSLLLVVFFYATCLSQPKTDTLLLEVGTIHLGDGDGNQGISYTKSFYLSDSLFSILDTALLKVEFIPPYGPNYEQPPILSINNSPLGSIQPFFPPLEAGNWQTNGDGSHDYNDSLHVSLGIPKTLLVVGENSFNIQNGRPDDDYQFTEVKVILTNVIIDYIPLSPSGKIPHNYALRQNYPNPFNPGTTIMYSVSKSSLVTIKVYDVLGNEIETLVNEEKKPGNYSVQLTAGIIQLSSGVYFYRMQAGNFSETKKLVFLK